MVGGVGNLKVRFNNVSLGRNLNQNMPYIALFLKKSKNLMAVYINVFFKYFIY